MPVKTFLQGHRANLVYDSTHIEGSKMKITEENLRQDIKKLKLEGFHLREIAKSYGISHGVVAQILKGRFPKRNYIRDILDLSRIKKIEYVENGLTVLRAIPIQKIGICRHPHCNGDFIRWAPNRKYCDIHSRAVRRKQK